MHDKESEYIALASNVASGGVIEWERTLSMRWEGKQYAKPIREFVLFPSVRSLSQTRHKRHTNSDSLAMAGPAVNMNRLHGIAARQVSPDTIAGLAVHCMHMARERTWQESASSLPSQPKTAARPAGMSRAAT